jgi:hypothetical protein
MRAWFLVGALVLVACEADTTDFPTPTADPVASSSGTGGSGGATTSGTGGEGASSVGWKSGTRLRAMTMDSADGARQFWAWWDSERNERCQYGTAADGETRCLPTARALALHWGDPGCAQTRLVAAQDCLAPEDYPTYAVQLETVPCGQRTHILALGGQWQSQVWTGSPSNCMSVPQDPNVTYYEVGAEVPGSSFAAGEIVTE